MTLDKFAFIDVETTGSSPYYDRVIDVGVVVYDHGQVVETWESLVNPGMSLAPIITSITGIIDEDLKHAPTFEMIAGELLKRLEGRVFVGHNVAFDYTFIRQEFLRLGEKLTLPQLCTVRLSRKLFPHENKHNLDALMQRFSLRCDNRHRALPDADVTCQFFDTVHKVLPKQEVYDQVVQLIRRPTIPYQMNLEAIEALPEAHGVYVLYDAQGKMVFTGKADNIREKVFALFYSDMSGNKYTEVLDKVVHVEAIPTAGDMDSYFKVVALKGGSAGYGNSRIMVSTLSLRKNEQGYLQAVVEVDVVIGLEEVRKTYIAFKTGHYLRRKLKELAERDLLCLKMLGLETADGPCSHVKSGLCLGACTGALSPIEHNLKIQKAFYDRQIKNWPFNGVVAYYEEDALTELAKVHVFDQWCYLGSFSEISEFYDKYPDGYPDVLFDVDIYGMLKKFFSNRWKKRKFKELRLKSMPLDDEFEPDW